MAIFLLSSSCSCFSAILFFFLFVVSLSGSEEVLRDAEALFEEFCTKYSKVYSNEEDRKHRMTVFKESLQIIDELNEDDSFQPYGVGPFADLTQEEFARRYLMKKGSVTSTEDLAFRSLQGDQMVRVDYSSLAIPPDSFDWRTQPGAVTPVKNQWACGSCWAFSVTENVESVWAIEGKHPIKTLSVEQIINCDKTDNGCDGGDTVNAYKYIMEAGGLEKSEDYPYTAKDGKCEFNSSLVYAAISGYDLVTQTKNETEMQIYLYNKAPLSVCVDSSGWQYYSSGILTKCGQGLDHCVQATGYGSVNGTDYWVVRNSWGTDWGLEGYILVERNNNTCGIAKAATSAFLQC